MKEKALVVPDVMKTHSPVGDLVMRPLGFIGVVLAFVATLALMVIPPFQPSYAGPPGPVEMWSGKPPSK